jgi:hypothetical protein
MEMEENVNFALMCVGVLLLSLWLFFSFNNFIHSKTVKTIFPFSNKWLTCCYFSTPLWYMPSGNFDYFWEYTMKKKTCNSLRERKSRKGKIQTSQARCYTNIKKKFNFNESLFLCAFKFHFILLFLTSTFWWSFNDRQRQSLK